MASRRGVDGRWTCGRGGCRWPRGECPTHTPAVVCTMTSGALAVALGNGVSADRACETCGYLVHQEDCPARRRQRRVEFVPYVPNEPALPPGWAVPTPNDSTANYWHPATEQWVAQNRHSKRWTCRRHWEKS